MSDPSLNPSALALIDTTTPSASSPTPPPTATRDYRKGNWTLHETLILIDAKRLDDERRARGSQDLKHHCPGGRSAELRWKWVENYCWKHGCLRSQNQCNDKWDNLLRDYKKVRDYESRISSPTANDANGGRDGGGRSSSYWTMEKHERKDRNLPSNLASEVFDALTDVLSRRNALRANSAATPISARLPPASPPPPPPPHASLPSPTAPLHPPPPPPPQLQQMGLPPPQAPRAAPSPSVQPSVSAEMSESSDSGVNEPEAKRRKTREIGSSVTQGATMLARALLACEDRRDKRHSDLVALEERRLRIEEDRTEMGRQGIAGLISAVNNLSGAIHSLVSHHHHAAPSTR